MLDPQVLEDLQKTGSGEFAMSREIGGEPAEQGLYTVDGLADVELRDVGDARRMSRTTGWSSAMRRRIMASIPAANDQAAESEWSTRVPRPGVP